MDDVQTYLDEKAALLKDKDMEGLLDFAQISEPEGIESNGLYYELPENIASFS
jgi:hypothetical protein